MAKDRVSIKDSDGNILTDENEILSRWREYFEDLLNPVKASSRDTHEVTHPRGDEVFTAAEVATVIKGIKSGRDAGKDEITPEILKALTGEGILWLTRVCQVVWKLGKIPRDLQTGVIIPIFKKGDRKQCTNYRRISLLSLPGKVYAKCLERKCREIVESKLEDGQSGFHPGCSTTDQIVVVVVVTHIFPPVTGQHQTLTCWTSAHFSLPGLLCDWRNPHLLRSFR